MSDVRDEGYDDFLDALDAGEGYYLSCANGHGWFPPRRVCPECGSQELTEEPLPDAGEIVTHTTISVATPSFDEDTPYVTAVADFGPVQLTGQVRGVDPEAVETGMVVGAGLEETETTGDPLVVFRPR